MPSGLFFLQFPEKPEKIKGVIRSRRSIDKGQPKKCLKEKGKKTNSNLHNNTQKTIDVNPGTLEVLAVPAPLVAPVVLLLNRKICRKINKQSLRTHKQYIKKQNRLYVVALYFTPGYAFGIFKPFLRNINQLMNLCR